MATNVTAEEADALAESAPHAAHKAAVAARDFREPRRLAPEQLARLARGASRAIEEIEASLRVWLRASYEIEIASVSEVDARIMLQDVKEPWCLLAFDCAGRTGWAAWDATMASAATEIALGTTSVDEPRARALSVVEQGVVRNMLGRAIGLIAQSLDVQVANLRYVPDLVRLELERADAREGDATRVAVNVALSGPLGESTLRLYLAGVRVPSPSHETPAPPAKDKDAKKKPATPEHLGDVPFELGAQLGHAEVALSDLLGLEPGDVIPLDAALAAPLAVYVDGIPCASARFGEHKGRLAIQLLSFHPPEAEPQT